MGPGFIAALSFIFRENSLKIKDHFSLNYGGTFSLLAEAIFTASVAIKIAAMLFLRKHSP